MSTVIPGLEDNFQDAASRDASTERTRRFMADMLALRPMMPYTEADHLMAIINAHSEENANLWNETYARTQPGDLNDIRTGEYEAMFNENHGGSQMSEEETVRLNLAGFGLIQGPRTTYVYDASGNFRATTTSRIGETGYRKVAPDVLAEVDFLVESARPPLGPTLWKKLNEHKEAITSHKRSIFTRGKPPPITAMCLISTLVGDTVLFAQTLDVWLNRCHGNIDYKRTYEHSNLMSQAVGVPASLDALLWRLETAGRRPSSHRMNVALRRARNLRKTESTQILSVWKRRFGYDLENEETRYRNNRYVA